MTARDLEAENARLREALEMFLDCDAFIPSLIKQSEDDADCDAERREAVYRVACAALSLPSASEQSAPSRDLEAENARLLREVRLFVELQTNAPAAGAIYKAARTLLPQIDAALASPSASEQRAPSADGFVEDATDVALDAFDDAYDAEYKLSGCIDNKRTSMKVAVQAVIAMCAMDEESSATVAGSPDAWRG